VEFQVELPLDYLMRMYDSFVGTGQRDHGHVSALLSIMSTMYDLLPFYADYDLEPPQNLNRIPAIPSIWDNLDKCSGNKSP